MSALGCVFNAVCRHREKLNINYKYNLKKSALHFTSLTDLFTQIPSRLLWEASSHMLQLMHEGCSYTYPPLSIARYSFIQLSELEQCRVKNLAQDFNTAAQDSNPGSRSRESKALPLIHGTLCFKEYINSTVHTRCCQMSSSGCPPLMGIKSMDIGE